MDIHIVNSEDFSVEDVVRAHMKDLEVEQRYGVKQIMYWVNTDAKTIFCLMKGPNRKACNLVHQEAHGLTACNIIEVTDDEYELYLGQGVKDKNDLAHHKEGEIDSGLRTMLCVEVINPYANNKTYLNSIIDLINKFKGVVVKNIEEHLIANFVEATSAVQCSIEISDYIKKTKLQFKIAVVSGEPVDEFGNKIFENTINRGIAISVLGLTNIVSVDTATQILLSKENRFTIESSHIRELKEDDIGFMNQVYEIFHKHLHYPHFNAQALSDILGLSTSQAYRKLKKITNNSPNQLIQETRLISAVKELKRGEKNVSEIAYDLGYNSPAYFTKVFKRRFKELPSTLLNV